MRRRRRDRDRARRAARLRPAHRAHPPRRLPGADARRDRPPRSFVAFDLLALGDDALLDTPLDRPAGRPRRGSCADADAPVHLAPATTDAALAQEWFEQYEGAGLDGVIAKPLDLPYRPDARLMFKIKHERTADVVVAGYRFHKSGPIVGSLLLGLYDDDGRPPARRRLRRLLHASGARS